RGRAGGLAARGCRSVARRPARRRATCLLPGTEISRGSRSLGHSGGHGEEPDARRGREIARNLEPEPVSIALASGALVSTVMSSPPREHLLGYLLGALSPDEHEQVE